MNWRTAVLAVTTALVLPAGLAGQQPQSSQQVARPSVKAAARVGAVSIDGVLNDEAWTNVPATTSFVQFDPDNGREATQKTELRFMYDQSAFYIAARMHDDQGAAGVRTRLGRRDQQGLEGDNVLFVLDTFHDHTGRTMFQINPSGVKLDAGQASPFTDPSWDPVWEVSTRIDSLGWTAEIRIPFSQLRFQSADVQTWGMQVWRYVERLRETSMWAFWNKQESGGPPLFGHIEEIHVPARQVGVELLPYVLARAERITPLDPANPFTSDATNNMRFGGDVKAILGSTLTLDATINPDFGQVEVDPAVVNLTAFETFFEEKRPFFVEGSGLFGFGGFNCYFCSNVQSLSLFYSRRVGRRPQGFVSGAANYVSMPDNTTILGAAKMTGRTKAGWQFGLLNAVTASEDADAESPLDERFTEEVEPLTNYFVGRVKRNLKQGNLQIGAIGTSVYRNFGNEVLRGLLSSHAEAVGMDWQAQWKERTYSWMGQLAFTNVAGDEDAIARLQRAPARYYQRPDREEHDNGFLTDGFDPTSNALRGLGMYTRVGKQAGTWLWETAANIRTPGFEANDLAFVTRTDYAWFNGNVRYQENDPTKYTRFYGATLGGQNQYNFDGDRIDGQLHGSVNAQLANYWGVNAFLMYRPEVDDDRVTRGGPVVRRATLKLASANVSTDPRRAIVLSANGQAGKTSEGGKDRSVSLDVRFKPAPNVTVSLGPSLSSSRSNAGFVTRFTDASATNFFGQRIVFAQLEQRTVAMVTRVSATFSPTLTLEVFAQPFVSAGEYEDFREFTAPRTLEKRSFDAAQLRAIRSAAGRDSVYVLDPDRDAATANFQFRNPDFNFRSLRGNAVLRWEYRPGSTLFLVWQQSRAQQQPYGDFDLGRDTDAVFASQPDNIFVMKVSYWFGR
jgi:hypothetical protein